MIAAALPLLYALCSVIGFVNVYALWRDREVRGVSLVPSVLYSTTNLIEIPFFLQIGSIPLAVGASLMAIGNVVWLALALRFRVRPSQFN